MSRFEFLKKEFPKLYKRCLQAEEAADTEVMMLKSRQALEMMVRELGGEAQDLFLGIQGLEENGILDEQSSHLFHALRRQANQAIHEGRRLSPAERENCLNQLLELATWFAAKQEEKKQLHPYDMGVNPLGIDDDFAAAERKPQDKLAKDVFETQAEYEQRIASLPPVHVGYGTLDLRRGDGFTDLHFLVHQRDQSRKIKIPYVNAFFVEKKATVKKIIEGDIFARLRVYQKEIWCDYREVFLRTREGDIPLQIVRWEALNYETQVEYKKRIAALPVIPIGIVHPLREQYDLQEEKLAFVIKPFRYMEGIFRALFPQQKLILSYNRQQAKALCSLPEKILLFGRVELPYALTECYLWSKSLGAFYHYNEREQQEKAAYYLKKESEALTENEQVQWLRAAAEAGHANAQNRLGVRYHDGNGVEQSYEKAAYWYQKAAKAGDAWGENNLATCYFSGRGVGKDYSQAFAWYQKAADQGLDEAQNNLGNLYYSGRGTEKNEEMAAFWYEKAAWQGNMLAENNLGECYYDGEGVEQDYHQAVIWYEKAAAQGYSRAQNHLGVCYYDGNGVEQDYQKAVQFFRQAAQHKNDWGAYNLGNCYLYGCGVEEDPEMAKKCYQRSAAWGNEDAKKKLQEFAETETAAAPPRPANSSAAEDVSLSSVVGKLFSSFWKK